mgnify:CR=1 FL=1
MQCDEAETGLSQAGEDCCRKVLHPAKSVQVSTETAHHTPKGQVDSEIKPWWIQVDSSGFEWIRTLSTKGDCAPV